MPDLNSRQRRVALLDELDSGEKYTVPNLAFEFGVDERTIRRDIKRLIEEGHTINQISGGHGEGGIQLMHRRPDPEPYKLNSADKEFLLSLCDEMSGSKAIRMAGILKKLGVKE